MSGRDGDRTDRWLGYLGGAFLVFALVAIALALWAS